MKHIKRILIGMALLVPVMLQAQIDTVLVEKYYISDANDAIGTNLPEGSITYRVYLQLVPGTKIKSLFGDVNHAIKIWGTKPFYNHPEGKSFGKDIDAATLNQNTLALDSWLTLGLSTKSHLGVMKTDDTDGSIVGGNNNMSGMLAASNPEAGIALVQKDGMVPMDNNFRFYLATLNGKEYPVGTDTTIFGFNAIVPDTAFISNNFSLLEAFGNVFGVGNKILLAQLTTNGELHFELNVELTTPDNRTAKFVARDAIVGSEVLDTNLIYHSVLPVGPVKPKKCGCPDKSFMEYDSDRECDSVELCKTKIVLGCTDQKACNYNPEANVSDGLCCYPGSCGDRDITFVCPDLGESKLEFKIFPNPVQEELKVEINSGSDKKTRCLIVDPFGRVVKDIDFGVITDPATKELNVSNLPNGLYMVKIYRANENGSKIFIKE